MDNNSQRPKDPCVYFRSVIRTTTKSRDALNPQGWDRTQLYLDQEQATNLITFLQENLENPRGVKLELNIKKRANQQNGNVFDSAYAFMKPVQETQATGGQRPQGAPRFVPKGTPTQNTFARTAKVTQQLGDEQS